MKVIIAGSRTREPTIQEISQAVSDGRFDVTEVVSGGARGADQHGEFWAEYYDIPIRHFPAQWDKHGKSAGFCRNAEMGEYADALLAFWDGQSRGTKHMIEFMQAKEKPIFIVRRLPAVISPAEISGYREADFLLHEEYKS